MTRSILLVVAFCVASLAAGNARAACQLNEVEARKRTPLQAVDSGDLIHAGAWDCLDAKRDDKRRDTQELLHIEYGRRAAKFGGLPAFFFRSLSVSGQLGETNTTSNGFDDQGISARIGSSKSTRKVTVGYQKKRLLEDLAVMFNSGPDLPGWVDKSPSGWPMLSVRGLILKPVTVDATFEYGRTVDFKNNTTNLDDLSTEKEWSVTARYSLPIDGLLGLAYKTE